jgi:superoxide dismutase
MNVWEHSFMRDYGPTERSRYVEAFFANIAWGLVDAAFKVTTPRGGQASRSLTAGVQ